MMGVDHPGLSQPVQADARERRRAGRATIQNSSIGNAGLRFYDAGSATFEGGGGIIITDSGYIQMDGDLTGAGDFIWTGEWQFTGEGTVTGDVAWSGDFTLTGEMIVAGSGRILVGDMIIDPSSGGSVAFPGGAFLQADPGGGIRLSQGTNRVYVGTGLVSMQMGSRSVAIAASGIQMNGLDTIPSGLAGGAAPGTLWSDGSEVLRVV